MEDSAVLIMRKPILKSWFSMQSLYVVPTGIIMPFMGTAGEIPTGWSLYTTGDQRGVLATHSAGVAGGSWALTGTAGSYTHKGGAQNTWCYWNAGSVGAKFWDTNNVHNHTSTITASPHRRYQIFMKSQDEFKKFPARTGFLSGEALTDPRLADVTSVAKDCYLFYQGGGSDSANHGQSVTSGNSGSVGSHAHGSGLAGTTYASSNHSSNVVNGAHSHTVTVTSASLSLQRYYMGLWESATQEMETIPGMYGLWEDAVAPEKWAFCDGTNGTPNLNSHFINLNSDGGVIGTFAGNHSSTIGLRYNNNGGHGHVIGSAGPAYGSSYHGTFAAHQHTGTANGGYIPPYTSIRFIKFIG